MRISKALPVLAVAALYLAGCTGPAVPATPVVSTSTTSALAVPSEAPSTASAAPTATPSSTDLPVPLARPAGEVSLTPPTAEPTETALATSSWTTMNVKVSTAAEAAQLTGTPADFRTFVAGKVGATEASGCASRYTIKGFNPAGFAIGEDFAPGCGGAMTIWGKTADGWGIVTAMQAAVPCDELARNLVPKQAPGLQCIDGTGALVAY